MILSCTMLCNGVVLCCSVVVWCGVHPLPALVLLLWLLAARRHQRVILIEFCKCVLGSGENGNCWVSMCVCAPYLGRGTFASASEKIHER